jgi:hypothetical protein
MGFAPVSKGAIPQLAAAILDTGRAANTHRDAAGPDTEDPARASVLSKTASSKVDAMRDATRSSRRRSALCPPLRLLS